MDHEPVLLHEVVRGLDLGPGLTVLDATAGGGGHSLAIGKAIGASGKLIVLDADPEAIARARSALAGLPGPVIFRNGNFRDLETHFAALGISRVDRALFDLGLSSPQLADPTRGFSFQTDGPLLMTFDGTGTEGLNAARLVNESSVHRLTEILIRYGEERYARRIAEAIVAARKDALIISTNQLVAVIEAAVPKSYRLGRKHFATRTFQALRIATNDELGALSAGLSAVWRLLALQGRLAVISFHSLEARIVKEQFKNWQRFGEGRLLTKRAIRPGREEEIRNPRSRSATLRIVSKIK